MANELMVRMPALSATMTEGTLIRWMVAVGDEVREGQPVAEVETDKVNMELECPYAGTILRLQADPGDTIVVGDPVVTVDSESDDLLGGLSLAGARGGPAERRSAGGSEGGEGDEGNAAAQGGQGATTMSAPFDGIVPAPPPVRKRARELGIDLGAVTPSGWRGHVTHADLDHVLEAATAGRQDRDQPHTHPPAVAADAEAPTGSRGSTRRRAVRRATASLTTRSATVPQFTLFRRVDLTTAVQRRARRSWTTEVARALAAALWRHPELNGTWDAEREVVAPLEGVRIGIAVDTEHGLLVAGVDDPDTADPARADADVREAARRARDGALTGQDAAGLSSTVSNLGGMGVDRFEALLMVPQATILSMGRVVDTPVVVDGRVRPRTMIELGLTVDHRVADGADAARFLATIAQRLEG